MAAKRLNRMIGTLRKRRGLTLAQLAKKVSASEGYMSMLESGLRTPSLSMLKRLAKALGVPVTQLLE